MRKTAQAEYRENAKSTIHCPLRLAVCPGSYARTLVRASYHQAAHSTLVWRIKSASQAYAIPAHAFLSKRAMANAPFHRNAEANARFVSMMAGQATAGRVSLPTAHVHHQIRAAPATYAPLPKTPAFPAFRRMKNAHHPPNAALVGAWKPMSLA